MKLKTYIQILAVIMVLTGLVLRIMHIPSANIIFLVGIIASATFWKPIKNKLIGSD